ncbi:GntR family transcriptional regulator [uncultured Ilyobacter sp.]|uniref:GntR family transcriptional regulator n=1 Tax=uncultured Ilyobacter sp. TaxID=544433 RepID=UPI0029C7A659|nr:GntR family transcriptional regulator [uncultured Ilyobacter sp.]
MDLIRKEKKKNENNREFVYRVLKENILELHLKPGEGLSETEVAGILNVSRTPIREAFIKLSQEGLMNIYPQRGSFVSHIELDLVQEGIFAREIMEREVLKLACKDFPVDTLEEVKKLYEFQKIIVELSSDPMEFYKLDNSFHKLIFEGCKKNRIWTLIEQLNTHYNRLRVIDAIEKISTETILEHHKTIIEIIENRSVEKVDKIINEHLKNVLPKLEILHKKYPGYFQ